MPQKQTMGQTVSQTINRLAGRSGSKQAKGPDPGPVAPPKSTLGVGLPALIIAPALALAGLVAFLLLPGKDNRRWIQSFSQRLRKK